MADDILLSPGTFEFSVEKITANLLSQGGITSINILFYNDNAGLPGTQIGTTIQNLTPTTQTIIGSAFGYDAYEVVLDLPTPVSLSGDAVNPTTYWVQLVAIPTTAGTQVAWEATSLNLIGNPAAFDNLTGTWNPTSGPPFDLVFTAEGTCATCAPPTNLIVSNVTTSSADLTWTAGGSELEWEIEYGPAGFSQGSGSILIDNDGTLGETLSGLTGGTWYDFYVRALCSNGYTSVWSASANFKTDCASITSFPFEESFDTTSSTKGCWTNQYVSGTENWTMTATNNDGSITPFMGDAMAEFRTSNYGDVTKFVSPAMDLTSLTNPELSFYYANVAWLNDINGLRIYYKTSETGAWTQIGSDYTEEQTSWTNVILTLPNPSATYYIAFEATSNFGRGMDIDAIRIGESLGVPDPAFNEFSFYPNPIKNELTLKADQKIQQVVIYNLLGKEVRKVTPKDMTSTLDLANLNTGTYLMKVTINGSEGVYQIIKE